MVLNDGERSAEFDRQWPQLNDWIMVRRPPENASLFSPRLLSFVRDRFETYRIARDTTRWYRDMYGARERGRLAAHEGRPARDAEGVAAARACRCWSRCGRCSSTWSATTRSPTCTTRSAASARSPASRYVDLLPALRGQKTAALWAHPADWHPNELAHRLAAETLAPRVHALAPLTRSARVSFTPSPAGATRQKPVERP